MRYSLRGLSHLQLLTYDVIDSRSKQLQGRTLPKLILSICKRRRYPWMDVKAFYVLISRVRKFSALRVLQDDREGLDDVAVKQHDEYLHAWVHGYDLHGRWQATLVAAALNHIRKVRRAEEARRKEANDRARAEKARERQARLDVAKAARAAAAKAARQPSAKPAAVKRRAASAGQGAPTRRPRTGAA